jgi:cytochrome d ubiquinol oxidase subunit I
MRIALCVGGACAILQPVSGDLLAKFVFRTQPAKFAAMEAHFDTGRYAAMNVGGWVDPAQAQIRGAIRVPGILSFLAGHDVQTVVPGLNQIDRSLWPNVGLTHFCFDVMVGSGALMMVVAAWFFARWVLRRGAVFEGRWFLRAVAVVGPLGFVALEAGWVVTEAGRQPWVIQGFLKTADAVTPYPHVTWFLVGFVALYLLLAATVVVLLRYLTRDRRAVSHV